MEKRGLKLEFRYDVKNKNKKELRLTSVNSASEKAVPLNLRVCEHLKKCTFLLQENFPHKIPLGSKIGGTRTDRKVSL